MTLPLIPAGFDFGNGWIKISLDNKASKIPNWFTEKQPKGVLNKKTMKRSKPTAFSLLDNEKEYWFGQDTLSLSGHQEGDSDKLKSKHIRKMFKAVLYRWFTQQKLDKDWSLSDRRLNVVCGMPPELYQDGKARSKATKAYKEAFAASKKTHYINLPNEPSIPFFTAFGGLKPEALAWTAAFKLKPGFTLLVDLGFGTCDLCLLHSDEEMPVSTVTLNNGLLHSHHETNPTRPWEAELNTMTGKIPANYANITKGKIRQVARQIELAQLVVFGGGVQLLDEATLKDLKGYAKVFSSGKENDYDEFSNARWFENISRKLLLEKREKLLDERKKKELEKENCNETS